MREVHHVALLIGYGAAAVNPYLAMESVEDLVRSGAIEGVTPEQAVKNLIKALGKGVLKVMSKMGISTVASYRGAQVFEAIGLSQELVDQLLHRHASASSAASASTSSPTRRRPGTPSAYPPDGVRHPHRKLERRRGVPVAPRGRAAPVRPGHGLPPAALDAVSAATTSSSSTPPRVDEQAERLMTLRGLFELGGAERRASRSDRRGRAGQRDRQAVQHRRDELRLDQPGGPRDARHRHEPARRPLQHR